MQNTLNKLLIISLMLFTINIKAQTQLPNGTFASFDFLTEINNNITEEYATPFDLSFAALDVAINTNFYILKTSSGNTNINLVEIDASLQQANTFFAPIGIQFKKNNVVLVDEYVYGAINIDTPQVELNIKHARANEINIYLVESIVKDSASFYGYTYFPTEDDKNYIYLAQEHFNGINLSTQLGHFMGLLATHEPQGGTEHVDGSNCQSAGDYICDTYADPLLFGVVDENCLYQGFSVDPSGDFFAPSVANIMSDAPIKCRCVFTQQQYRRMYYYYKKYRQYLQ